MRLEISIATRLGGFSLQAEFAGEGGVTALFGRSGSGKTSVLNAIAGLLRPERGRIALDGEAFSLLMKHFHFEFLPTALF